MKKKIYLKLYKLIFKVSVICLVLIIAGYFIYAITSVRNKYLSKVSEPLENCTLYNNEIICGKENE